jgi:TolA-binding protein
MSDDVLAPWLAAYREENPGTALEADAIRRRVLLGLGAERHRQARVLRVVLPVAATFAGSVALAASQGALPRLADVREWLGVGATETGRRATDDGRAPVANVASPTPSSPPAVAAPRLDVKEPASRLFLDELPVEKPVRAQVPRRDPAAPTPRDPKSVSLPQSESGVRPEEGLDVSDGEPDVRRHLLGEDLRAYQIAYRVHFEGGIAALALSAWDEYLESYPTGAFAPEARLNRAECLIRLGRHDEARRVLTPVAESSSFAYGKERAQKLLEAMGD